MLTILMRNAAQTFCKRFLLLLLFLRFQLYLWIIAEQIVECVSVSLENCTLFRSNCLLVWRNFPFSEIQFPCSFRSRCHLFVGNSVFFLSNSKCVWVWNASNSFSIKFKFEWRNRPCECVRMRWIWNHLLGTNSHTHTHARWESERKRRNKLWWAAIRDTANTNTHTHALAWDEYLLFASIPPHRCESVPKQKYAKRNCTT